MKSFIFVRNKTFRPSTYYRIYQYLKDFDNTDFEINEFELNKFYSVKSGSKLINFIYGFIYALIPGYFRRLTFIIRILRYRNKYILFIQRECFPRFIDPLSKMLLKKIAHNASAVYWDIDDNIFDAREITEFEKELLKKYSKKIFVGNQFLLEKLQLLNSDKVMIVNTTDIMMENINLYKINIKRKILFEREIILIWVGTRSNLRFLEGIIPQLDASANRMKSKKIILKIVCDETLKISTKSLIIKCIKWDRLTAHQEMLNAHIGLMPLVENELTRGKCAFKAVQAIGCGLPVIVSDVGMNREVVQKNNGILIYNNLGWGDAVLALSESVKQWEEKSLLSRKLWVENFNPKEIRNLLMNALKNN
ncbi:MAG: hypothetical protein C6P35_07415 [Cohnella sp.]|uniref:glycosyltransferase n=1 Tax=Cohnella sp. TaxID=1883426 RepID=UPI000E39B32F|nr:glycosyltransferase [Cohnella sp.]REK66490.1 MAG: hypothetical protein C6P35_07415 [Cohnella sp.]